MEVEEKEGEVEKRLDGRDVEAEEEEEREEGVEERSEATG